ncbi:MAG: hypothetical protein U0797_15995 [Gemmataceae bacterium]
MKLGVLGGGQLGRMLALAGYPLGLRFRFLDPAPEAPVEELAELVVGRFDDLDVLARFPDGLDVVTYEFENVSAAEAASAPRPAAPVYPPVRAGGQPGPGCRRRSLFACSASAAVETLDESHAAVEKASASPPVA